MRKDYKSWSIAAVVLYCVFICCIPNASMLLGTGMLIKPLMVTDEANEMLSSGKVFELPSWINDCTRGDQQFNVENQFRTEDIEFSS